MNKLTYDISILVGLLLVAFGAGAQWGLAVACLVSGGLVIALTVLGAVLFAAKR